MANPAASWCRPACETRRKRARLVAWVLLVLGSLLAPGVLAAQGEAQPAEVHVEDAHAAEAEEHHASPVETVARLFNFAILAGTLVYLLRSPIAGYLADRGSQIRSDLVNAEETRRSAAAAIEDIDRKMRALPGELEALRAQGAREIAAEEARIRAAAAAERDRLLEQARRDIDQQTRIAERELVAHAADLAVALATERIRGAMTEADQQRLADRYVQQLTRSSDAPA